MQVTITASLSAFLIALIAIKFFKPIAVQIGLVDKPDSRKMHQGGDSSDWWNLNLYRCIVREFNLAAQYSGIANVSHSFCDDGIYWCN